MSQSLADGTDSLLIHISRLSLTEIDALQALLDADLSFEQVSDEDLAIWMFAEEARSLLTIAREFRDGNEDYGENVEQFLLEELEEMEEMARYDREVAIAISEDRTIPPPNPRRRKSSHTSSKTGTRQSTSELISQPITPVEEAKIRDCTICREHIIGTVYEVSCGHFFDMTCLEEMFRKATVEESSFPPRCCQPIPIPDVRKYLSPQLLATYEDKAIEFSTAARVYCYRSTCSRFLGAVTTHPLPMLCPTFSCEAFTCGHCGEEAHVGRACSVHLNEPVLALAKVQKWQRCSSCRHLVERIDGCNHIICMCGKQFCYACGMTWKECACPQFDVPPDT